MSRLVSVFVVGIFAIACGRPPAPAVPIPHADPRARFDPINRLEVAGLRVISRRVLDELIAALPANHRRRVTSVPLLADARVGDINAYASCAADGTPIIAIGDGLLLVAAHLAMTDATDELFDTELQAAYLTWLEANASAPPPPGFYAPSFQADRVKLAVQRARFEEIVAFVLAHELAHHYLGHLACTSDGGLIEEVGQLAAEQVPLFSQIGELAADVAGVKNLLAAGVARHGPAWTEDGALLVIAAFHRRRPLSVRDLAFGFERSHPLPHLRIPVITTTAELWHSSGGYLPL